MLLRSLAVFCLLLLTPSLWGEFGTHCYNYQAPIESNGWTFQCRKVGDALYVDGVIDELFYEELIMWDQPGFVVSGQKPLRKIYLNSRGGKMFSTNSHTATAVDIMQFIRQQGIETYVLPGQVCKSACVPIFVAGKKRMAAKDSEFLVHSVRMGELLVVKLQERCGQNFANPACKAELSKFYQQQLRDTDRYFTLLEEAGVASGLRDKYFRGGQDLNSPGNGNLLGLVDLTFTGEEALAWGVAQELF